jgi:uncharacterized protein with HEPN domain
LRRRTAGLLQDIRDAARFILDDIAGETAESHAANRRTRQLVERNFEIVGEAMRRLEREDPKTAARFPEARAMVGSRNVIAHGYDVVDHEWVWRTVHESLPPLLRQVEEELERFGRP